MRDRPPFDLKAGADAGAYVPDLRTCEACGEQYDHNHLGQMVHHEMSGEHEPMSADPG